MCPFWLTLGLRHLREMAPKPDLGIGPSGSEPDPLTLARAAPKTPAHPLPPSEHTSGPQTVVGLGVGELRWPCSPPDTLQGRFQQMLWALALSRLRSCSSPSLWGQGM